MKTVIQIDNRKLNITKLLINMNIIENSTEVSEPCQNFSDAVVNILEFTTHYQDNSTTFVPSWAPIKDWIIALNTIMMIPIIGGNLLVLLAYRRCDKLQSVANIPLLSLALTDLFTGTVAIPWAALFYYRVEAIQPNPFLCLSYFIFLKVPCGVSGMTLLLIAIMRFLAVLKPLKYKALVTSFRVKSVIGFLWVYIFCIVVGYMVLGSKWQGNTVCTFAQTVPMTYTLTIAGHIILVGIVAAILYGYIGRVIVKRGKKVSHMRKGSWMPKKRTESTISDLSSVSIKSGKGNSVVYADNCTCKKGASHTGKYITKEKSNRLRKTNTLISLEKLTRNENVQAYHTKAVKMMVIVMICFYLSWVPYTVYLVCIIRTRDGATDPGWLGILGEFAVSCVIMNSFLNPIIYAGMDINFRNAFMKILHIARQET